jgi:hypothetical protein
LFRGQFSELPGLSGVPKDLQLLIEPLGGNRQGGAKFLREEGDFELFDHPSKGFALTLCYHALIAGDQGVDGLPVREHSAFGSCKNEDRWPRAILLAGGIDGRYQSNNSHTLLLGWKKLFTPPGLGRVLVCRRAIATPMSRRTSRKTINERAVISFRIYLRDQAAPTGRCPFQP